MCEISTSASWEYGHAQRLNASLSTKGLKIVVYCMESGCYALIRQTEQWSRFLLPSHGQSTCWCVDLSLYRAPNFGYDSHLNFGEFIKILDYENLEL